MEINQRIETYADVAAVLQQLARWMERERKKYAIRYGERFLSAEEHVIEAWMRIQEATR